MRECCCCCIPIRAGTLILAFISAVLSGLLAGFAFKSPDLFGDHLPSGLITALGVLFIVFCLASIFGFIGSFSKSFIMIKFFSIILWIITILHSLYIIAFTVLLFIYRSKIDSQCAMIATANAMNTTITEMNSNTPLPSSDDCKSVSTLYLVVHVILYVIIIAFELYFASVVSSYASILSNQKKNNNKNKNLEGGTQPPNAYGSTPKKTAFDSKISLNEAKLK